MRYPEHSNHKPQLPLTRNNFPTGQTIHVCSCYDGTYQPKKGSCSYNLYSHQLNRPYRSSFRQQRSSKNISWEVLLPVRKLFVRSAHPYNLPQSMLSHPLPRKRHLYKKDKPLRHHTPECYTTEAHEDRYIVGYHRKNSPHKDHLWLLGNAG